MKITKRSMITGKVRTREIDITPEQITNWKDGMLIQHAFPNLSNNDREFIMTGITEEEWNETMSEDNFLDSSEENEEEGPF